MENTTVGHTPGPWTVREDINGNGGLLRRGEQMGPNTHVQSSLQILPLEDARLIAAAPDLLDACKRWISERDSPAPCWAMKKQAEDKMRAAIAKAEGRAR